MRNDRNISRRKGLHVGDHHRSAWPSLLIGVLVTVFATGCSSGDTANDDSASRPGTDRIPVIFSTDMAMGLTTGGANGVSATPPDIDDSWAFALAATHDELDIRGVVVTYGNGMAAPEMTTAKATVEALGKHTRVVKGASIWLPVKPIADYDGTSLDDSCVNEGVRFMVEQLRHIENLTIVAIGPLTDVACVALNFPDDARRIKEIIALVGAKPNAQLVFNGKSLVDFNYVMDPRAEQVLLKSTKIPFTAIMFELSSTAAISTKEILRLANMDDPRARFFGRASTAYAKYWKKTYGSKKPIWDAAVVWRLIEPDAYKCESAGYKLQTGPPASFSDKDIIDWFSPKYTDTRQVTACSSFKDQREIDSFLAAVLSAVSGSNE